MARRSGTGGWQSQAQFESCRHGSAPFPRARSGTGAWQSQAQFESRPSGSALRSSPSGKDAPGEGRPFFANQQLIPNRLTGQCCCRGQLKVGFQQVGPDCGERSPVHVRSPVPADLDGSLLTQACQDRHAPGAAVHHANQQPATFGQVGGDSEQQRALLSGWEVVENIQQRDHRTFRPGLLEQIAALHPDGRDRSGQPSSKACFGYIPFNAVDVILKTSRGQKQPKQANPTPEIQDLRAWGNQWENGTVNGIQPDFCTSHSPRASTHLGLLLPPASLTPLRKGRRLDQRRDR